MPKKIGLLKAKQIKSAKCIKSKKGFMERLFWFFQNISTKIFELKYCFGQQIPNHIPNRIIEISKWSKNQWHLWNDECLVTKGFSTKIGEIDIKNMSLR